MPAPLGFYWVEKPRLAGLANPESEDDLAWLRRQGIELLVSLTQDPPRRDWVEDAGLLVYHLPLTDMEAPEQEDLDLCVSAISRAYARGMGVAVHCTAGLGRTGTVLACFLVRQGMTARDAVTRVRRLRPGSVETVEQEEAVAEFARRHRK
jgi:atypical dual specificity phosphatase